MYGKGYFFEAFSWNEGFFTCFELYENFRQRDPEFLETLNKIRVGRVSQSDLDSLNARVCSQPPEDVLVLASRNYVVE